MKLFSKKALAAKPKQTGGDTSGNFAVKGKVGAVTAGTKGGFGKITVVKNLIKTAQGAVGRKKPVPGEARADHAVERMVTGLNKVRVSRVMPKVY